VWLGANYPRKGEYNLENDIAAMNYLLESEVDFEMVMVRYGEASGSDAVRTTPADMEENMPGAGVRIEEPVLGRHGNAFSSFGDYSIDLFHHIDLYGEPPSRALFDVVAVAIIKDPEWGASYLHPAPIMLNESWMERPLNPRKITIWEHFDADAIVGDFFHTMNHPILKR
jgi:purine nucleosidase